MESTTPSYRYQYGGKMISTKIEEPTFKDIGQFSKIIDIPIILTSILAIDVFIIFISRYTGYFGTSLNRWYDEFGLNAVIADVLIIFIGFLIARFVWSIYFQSKYGWNILYFLGLLIFVQALHDLFFYLAIIKPLPAGHNEMMDVMKTYAVEEGGYIIVGDSFIMIGSALLASFAKVLPLEWQVVLSTIVLYCVPYILYTKSVSKKLVPKVETAENTKPKQGSGPGSGSGSGPIPYNF